MLHLRSPRIAIITYQTSRIGGDRSPSNGEALEGKNSRLYAWGGSTHTRGEEGGRKVGSEKEDLPRGKVRWREREETIDRGGGGARAGTTTATTG